MTGVGKTALDPSWNVMAYGDVREGKWRGNWRMEWVASTLHTTSEHGVSSITTADAHTSAPISRLNWRSPADWNGLVRFTERLNLISACVPSHFKRSLRHRHVGPDRKQARCLRRRSSFYRTWSLFTRNFRRCFQFLFKWWSVTSHCISTTLHKDLVSLYQ